MKNNNNTIPTMAEIQQKMIQDLNKMLESNKRTEARIAELKAKLRNK